MKRSLIVVLLASCTNIPPQPATLPERQDETILCDSTNPLPSTLTPTCEYAFRSSIVFTGIIEEVDTVSWPAVSTREGVVRLVGGPNEGCRADPATRIRLRVLDVLRGYIDGSVTVLVSPFVTEMWMGATDALERGSLLGVGVNPIGSDFYLSTQDLFTIDTQGRIINQEPICRARPVLDVATFDEMRSQLESCPLPNASPPPLAIATAYCRPAI